MKQRKRDFNVEQNLIIRAEIEKLLEADHIREVQFLSWLANVVPVSKPSNKWRVYIDFRDLNKAYSKDFYPLPRIDQMADFTVGCELICMLDTYQEYHQVSLTREDQEKVNFITVDGTYYYNVMPFGLKNVDATYQRLMNKGSGIGVLFISPQDERMQLSVRLDYRATNNEVEYEALIVGLQAARHVEAIKVLIHSDSQLVAQQLTGTFEISNTRLKLYAEAFEKLKVNFREVVIQKIPRAENQAADELAKLASSLSPIIISQPIEQVSLVAHIDRMGGSPFQATGGRRW
ncbi:uncharacterized protein LOC122054784 [Zingiber officinale]|uniref:uncharacterized protein LOC122054784 n=1 Tax=Zingiber officinale TaxID=94328 RepID=UPI001C4BD1AD|nr:uncharacterized protein LOC122054784 [Zingiber officinale]